MAVALPLAAAVAAPLLGRLSTRLPVAVGVAALAGAGVVLALAVPSALRGEVLVHYLGGLRPVRGQALGITFAADGFGLVQALSAAAVGAVVLVFGGGELGGYGRRETAGLTALYLLLDAAVIGAALTADLFNLFVWFEVAALASYALTGFLLERPHALEAALKVLVLTTVASFTVFAASALLYAGHGALSLGQFHGALAAGLGRADVVALGMLTAGYATKAGLVPFHGWLPDAHSAAPGPASAPLPGSPRSFRTPACRCSGC